MTLSTSSNSVEIRLIKFFLKNITEKFGIREISRKINIDYKLVHTNIQKLLKKNVVLKERHANIDLCFLNIKDDLTYIYFVEMLIKDEFLQKYKNFKSFFKNVLDKIKDLHFTLVIFGSFAKAKENKGSDLDLLVIGSTRDIAEEIQRVINSESIFIKRKIQSISLDEKEFVSNLSDKKLNVVVESFKNHIIIAGVEPFYKGLKQAL